MFLPIVECIYIPSDEGKAVMYLSSLIEHHLGIAVRAERTLAVTGSARTVLESLIEDGTFERISEDHARSLEGEVRRYEAKELEQADVAADVESARPI